MLGMHAQTAILTLNTIAKTIDARFERFISERHQIRLVTNQFGTTVGLVTLEGIIETIFGI